MKKPHKTYRFLGGHRSPYGRAFRLAQSPLQSLRQAFGRDLVARDAAENLSMETCRRGFQLVMATVRSWGELYRGPKLSSIFRSMNGRVRPVPEASELEPS